VKSPSPARALQGAGQPALTILLYRNRDSLLSDLFPGRSEVPKTLVFCRDDHHAEEVVGIVHEVFGKGNDFAKKITYRTDGATQSS
jgi:type I restriction enzyme, R subunit